MNTDGKHTTAIKNLCDPFSSLANKKVVILGDTGKMGTALQDALGQGNEVVGLNSSHFDAAKPEMIKEIIAGYKPDIIFNTIAFMGIDQCEADPHAAFTINTLFPKVLAEIANKNRALLVHFSTDAVFDDLKKTPSFESDTPAPINLYGLTKYGGDCCIMAEAHRFYVIRLSVLFGPSVKKKQFVEKMISSALAGEKVIKVADDIIASPSYSNDVAEKVSMIVSDGSPFGVYHVANEGEASLYDLICEVMKQLGQNVVVEPASMYDFPFVGQKNRFSTIASEKGIKLRPWRQAVAAYCRELM